MVIAVISKAKRHGGKGQKQMSAKGREEERKKRERNHTSIAILEKEMTLHRQSILSLIIHLVFSKAF